MSWASCFLIKAAMRLGARARMGKLSPAVVSKLQDAGMFRSPETMQQGLAYGNVVLKRKLGLPTHDLPMESMNPEKYGPVKPGPRIAVAGGKAFAPTPEQLATMKPTKMQLGSAGMQLLDQPENVIAPGQRFLVTLPAARVESDYAHAFPMLGRRQATGWTARAAPVLKRHEINEIRALQRAEARHPNQLLKNKFSGHTHKWVPETEGADLTGLPRDVQRAMINLRTRTSRYSSELEDLKRTGGQLLGPYAWARTKPTYRKPKPVTITEEVVPVEDLPPDVAKAFRESLGLNSAALLGGG